MKGEYITIIIFAIILAVSLLLIMIYRKNLFRKKQEDKKNSLLQGYGFYSDPITHPCTNNTGKCTEASTQVTIFKCIPNPSTGKGCIDDEGVMSYKNKKIVKPCQQQCLGSLFTKQEGLEYKNITVNGKDNQILQGLGCNKVVNKITGLDETSFFIGDFDINTTKYKLKNCIPENYQGYYRKIYTCNNYDTTGANNCRYTCGQDGSIKLNGIYDTKLSKNVLMYYPTEFDQEGVKRHVCYDINDANQIEILNSVTEVPDDFYYPQVCYKHVNEYNIDNLNLFYPVGVSNVITSNLNYNTIQEKFVLANLDKVLSDSKLLDSNYDYYYDYENYIKIQLNNETMLIKKIENNISGKFLHTTFNNENIIGYINTGDGLIEDLKDLEYYYENGTLNSVGYYKDKFYEIESTDVKSTVLTFHQFLPIDIATMFEPEQGPYNISFGTSRTTIGDPNNELQTGDIIYYRGATNNYNNGNLVQVLEKGISFAITESILVNNIQDIYWRKTNAAVSDNKFKFIYQRNDNSTGTLRINYFDIIVTNNILLKNGYSYDNNRELLLTRNINTLSYYDNDSFFLFDKEVQTPGVKSTTNGFFYPLYLKTFTQDTIISDQGTSIFTCTDTGNINRTDKILFNDIQDKPFYLEVIDSNILCYYYPVYLTNKNYTISKTFSVHNSTIFYAENFDKKTTKPSDYLDYLEFSQYASLGMVYHDGSNYKYPIFLSKNFTDTHTHTFINYKDVTFYMPNNSSNHAIETPPLVDYKLTDFKNLFEIGTVNVDINNYGVSGTTFNVPNNAQINQEVFLDNFNSVNTNNDIQLYQNGTSIGNLIYDTSPGTNNIITVFREGDFLLNNVLGDNNFANKSRLYNKILETQSKKIVTNNISYDTIINPERKLLIAADYTLLQSPYIENPDGSTTNICYDKYNKPLAKGTQVTLNSVSKGGTASNKIVINVPCSDFNTDIGASCGVYGLSIGSQSCQQTRESDNYIIKSDTDVINIDNYMNEEGYMNTGLEISENKMVCLKKFRDPYNPNDNIKCFPTYFTQEEESGKKYAPDEEVYATRYKRDYYFSTDNDNTQNPLNPLFWDRVFVPTPDSEVSSYQNFIYNHNKNSYIFRSKEFGVTGLDPTKLAIQPSYKKNTVPYMNSNQYYFFTGDVRWWDKNNQMAIDLDPGNQGENLIYNNISYTFGGNNFANVPNDPNNIVNQAFVVTYQDEAIGEMNIEKGDIFQTGFTFFNNFIFHLISSYNTSVGVLPGVYANNIGVSFLYDSGNNSNFYDSTTTVIDYGSINNGIKVGEYLTVLPIIIEDNGTSDIFDAPNFQNLINENKRELFNPCFEIILVTDIDSSNKKLHVERNILNLNDNNYLYFELTNSILYAAVPLRNNLLDLNFPITEVDRTNKKISFDVNFNLGYKYVERMGGKSTNGISFLGSSEGSFLTPYISANYIKKNVSTPNQPTSDGDLKLYLASMPEDAKTISALLDLRIVNDSNQTYLYLNEFRTSRYQVGDTFKTVFAIGDTIGLEFDNNTEIKLKIISTNIFYKDTTFDKRYDYYCLLLSDTSKNNITTNLTNYTNSGEEYYLGYYYYDSIFRGNIQIIETPRPGQEENITYKYSGGTATTNIENIGFFPLDNSATATAISPPIVDKNILLQPASYLTRGVSIAYLKLRSTTFTSNKGTVIIDSIKNTGKAEGIIYYPNADIDGNTPNRTGSGFITSFKLNSINVVPGLQEDDEFISDNNYIIRATSKNIASFDYLDGDITSKNSISNYDNDIVYTQKQIVDYINPNQRIYYRNVDGEAANFNINTWQVRAESIYNESSVVDFAPNESYIKNTIVDYNENLWQATTNLFSGSNVPSDNNSKWKKITLTDIDLYSEQNNFYTFTNKGPNMTIKQLYDFNNENIKNYPLCISDYETQTNYCPKPSVKFPKELEFSNSFIHALPGASSLASIMGQAFLTHKDDDYLSLPAVPYNSANYTNAQYLKDCGDTSSVYNIGQYIYQIPILNNLDEGKPFCTGTWSETGVPDITFANSIVFFMLPVALENQDYPVFDVSQDSTILTKNNFSSRNKPFGMSVLSKNNGNYSMTTIGISDTTYIVSENDTNFKIDTPLLLTRVGGGSSVTVTINKTGYYPINSNNVTDRGRNYKTGDIWYFTSPDDNEITAHGYIQAESIDGGISGESFFTYYSSPDATFNYNGLKIISENGTSFNYNWTSNQLYTTDYGISEPQNFVPGIYSHTAGLEVYIADNGQGKPLQYNQYLIGTSNPAGQLSDGTSVYQVFEQDKFKCRMYGLFGSNYLSNISYRLDSNLINNLAQENPGLIFNPFSSDIFNNESIYPTAVGSSLGSPEQVKNMYDVFNIRSNDGTSSNITLLTNNFNKPATNSSSQPLPLAYNNGQLREFNIVNTTDLHDFFAVPYQGMSNIYMGPVQEALPVLEPEPTNDVIKFSLIRQSRKRTNIGTSFDCNFYFKPQTLNTVFPSGGDYILSQKNNNFFYSLGESTAIINLNNGINIKNNLEYTFDLTSTTLNNFALVFGKSSVQSSFPGSVIKDTSTVIDNGILNIYYNINDAQISYDQFTSKEFYTLKNARRNINIYYDTKLQPMTKNITLGMGFISPSEQNINYNNSIVISNNSP